MIREVKLENWRSHAETSIELSGGVNGLIGNMGSGKSSVLEAVTFALYGTTSSLNSREIQLDDVLRRTPEKTDRAAVEVRLDVDEEEYTLKREIERGSGTAAELYCNGEMIEGPSTTEVTDRVEELTGMDFKAFTRAVYSEQNRLDLFLEMRPGERKERLDQLLKLEKFEDARKTLVKVENSLKSRMENHQEELSELEEDLEREELENLRQDIEEGRQKKSELSEKLEKLEETLEKLEETREELGEKKSKREQISEEVTRLETRIESLEERLPETEIENPGKKLEEAQNRLENLREREEKRKEMLDKIDRFEERLEDMAEEEEKLEEQAEKYAGIDKVEDDIDEVDSKLGDLREELASIRSREEQLSERAEKLRSAQGTCPVCDRPLDQDHREEMLEEVDEEREELEEKRSEKDKEREKLGEKLESLEETRDKLLQFADAGKKLEELHEERTRIKENLEELRDELPEEPETRELEERIEELAEAVEREEILDRIEELQEKLVDKKEDREELEFDLEKLEKTREKVSRAREERSRLKQEMRSMKDILREKAKRLNQMEKQWNKREELEEKIGKEDRLLDFTHDYGNALKKSRKKLRQRYINRLNSLMEDLWSQIYPYDHYYSIRLNPEKDYRLELLDSEDNWVSAQGEASGGERHSAALVMRLGLVFILSPSTGFLILDEPTHNIDESGVSKLAETLRESRDLVDQLLVVTHDRELESATTGKLYNFEKSAGVTSVTEVS